MTRGELCLHGINLMAHRVIRSGVRVRELTSDMLELGACVRLMTLCFERALKSVICVALLFVKALKAFFLTDSFTKAL